MDEIKYLYNSLIDSCIYFLETTYESLYASKYDFDHQNFYNFAGQIIRKAKVTIPILYSIMYYIKRFRTAVRKCSKAIINLQRGITINSPEDLKKLFVTATILALKFSNDHVILNVEWKKFINISVEDINLCENQFFQLIEYNLSLKAENYYKFINDYLEKYRSKLNKFSSESESYTSTAEKSKDNMNSDQYTYSVNHPTISNNRDIPNCTQNNSNNNTSSNACLLPTNTQIQNASIYTLTPSQSSPYHNDQATFVSPKKPLTPNDGYYNGYNNNNNINYNNNANNYSSQNNNCFIPPQNVLYQDPINMEYSPQHSNINGKNNGYRQLQRSDTESTIFNNSMNPNNNGYPMNSPQSPNHFSNNRSNSDATINNSNSSSIHNSPLSSLQNFKNNSIYHPSEDDLLKEHLNNNNQVPLNKLLYHLHHYHMKQNTQQQQQQQQIY